MKRHYLIAAGAVCVFLFVLVRHHTPVQQPVTVPANEVQHSLVHQPSQPMAMVNGEEVWCSYSILSADEREKLFKGNGKYLKKIEALELNVHNNTDRRLIIKSDYCSMPFLHAGEMSDILNAAIKKKMKIALAVSSIVAAFSPLLSIGIKPAVAAGNVTIADRAYETRAATLANEYKHPGIFYIPDTYFHQRITSRGRSVKHRVRGRTYQERLIIEPGKNMKAHLFVPRKDLTSSMTVTLKDDAKNKFSLVARQAVRAV